MASSTFRGTISNDILTNPIKNTSYDIIVGLNGHDTINGANTAETIYGGNGLGTNGQLDNAANVDNDIIHGNGGNDTIYGQNGNDQLFGDAGVDKLYGGAGDDKLSGGDGLDVLDGGDGNDTLDGGSGVDVMSGGAGNDSYNVDNLLDQVIELTNGGTDTVFSTANTYSLTALASLVQAAQIENLTLNGATAFNGIGNALNNVLTGNDNANSLSGLDGNDTLAGGGGRDTLDGGAGNDKLDGGSGDDKLTGGAGNDELNGGSGIDAMSGGAGDDRYFVDATGDSVTELANQGTDTVNSAINYVLGNELENLVLAGSATKGTGNALNNTITGNAGDNELDGKQGNDTLVGGGGNDIYRIDSLGDVIIEGANEGAHDVAYVDVSGYTGSLANIDQVMYAGGTPEQAFTIEGRAGDDTIIVPTGTNLVINAGAGRDFISIADVVQKATLLMGSGADTLYLAQTTPPATPPADRVFPHYRVTDFSSADGDKIELGLQHLGQSLGYSGAEAKPYSVWQTAPAAGGDGVTINIETSGDTTADNFIDLSGVTAPLDQNHLLGVIYPAANSAPHTSDYQIRAAEDDVLSGALALTQMDPNAGDTVKVTSINGTAISAPGDQRAFIRLEHGNLYISPKNGDFVYLPDPNFHGTDVFRYGVADNH
ncbi:MAG: Ig-like domain-containing protein, partial [Janthinobacterium lividum]